MTYLLYFILFVLGLVVGSFLNVVSLRYQPGQGILNSKTIGGRSRCPVCDKQLVWYELIPIFSFLWQKGRCRHCGHLLSLQYPLIEIVCGLIFAGIPWYLYNLYQVHFYPLSGEPISWYCLSVLIWVLVFLLFVLLSVVDFRHLIIPNGLNLLLAVLGLALIFITDYYNYFDFLRGSFLGHYTSILGLRDNIWINHLFAALAGMALFGLLIVLSRGKAMGWGDFKLGIALSLVFGWPDILMILILAFVVGAIVCVILMIQGKKKLKDEIPFAPFLVIGATLTFFLGYQIINGYFYLFGLAAG